MRSILASIICVGLINLVKAADPHWGQGCAYIDQIRQIYCFGGEPFSANDKQIPVYSFNVTNNSVLDLSNPQWTTIPSTPGGLTPSASSQLTLTGIPGTDTVFLQGGMVCASCIGNPAFSYSASTNKWTQLNTADPV
ncbi:hypothetical protein CLU79DRAFT_745685 [Phycomyces nitens]|nr:hypothetical protein CLU79DRAFT_745678 [Phycomyces nitens]KAI9024985.1 hypothetical protein CLU79DRAFT_745685 [Phycomyces nitens]